MGIMNASKKHLHKYYLADTPNGLLWTCSLGCGHFMPEHYNHLMLGRESRCWKCDGKMRLDSDNMKESKPQCFECRNGVGVDELAELIRLQEIQDKLDKSGKD